MNATKPLDDASACQSFAHQAAKASWVSGLMVFFVIVFGGRVGSRVVIEFVALGLIAFGLLAGLVALFGIGKHGIKGILGPAAVGILVNGLLLFIFVSNFIAARAKAQRPEAAATVPTIVQKG